MRSISIRSMRVVLFASVVFATGSVAILAGEPSPETLRRYEAMRDKAAFTADAQWKVGLWCVAHGLEEEARDHFTSVVRIDPKRDAAWKKLGYQKKGTRWVTPAQIASEKEAEASTQAWGEKLALLHKSIHGGKGQGDALRDLTAISDPNAVPAIYREFGKGAKDQVIAIQALGQIRSVPAAKTLAYLAIFGSSADVRRRATETLRDRDPKAFAGALIELIVDPLKYEVKHVNGPESVGVLLIEGESFNVRRLYQAPAPDLQIRPGDFVTYDADGAPRILRPMLSPVALSPGAKPALLGRSFDPRDAEASAMRSVMTADENLRNDLEALETLNSERRAFRTRVTSVLTDAVEANPGIDRLAWQNWFADLNGYPRPKPRKKSTVDLVMPLTHDPDGFGDIVYLGTPGVGSGGGPTSGSVSS